MNIKCSACKENYKKFIDKNEREVYEHDCLLYEHLYQNKRITRIEVVK